MLPAVPPEVPVDLGNELEPVTDAPVLTVAQPSLPVGPDNVGEPSLRQNRDFRIVLAGQGISALGDAVSVTTMPLLVLALTGSGLQMGIVGVLQRRLEEPDPGDLDDLRSPGVCRRPVRGGRPRAARRVRPA